MSAIATVDGSVVQDTASRSARGVLSWLGQVVSWFVMLTVGAVLLAGVLVPRLAGATPYVVETGSMRPGFPPGTLVVVREADPATISAGDVITYQIRSGDPTVVTHRVIAIGYDGAGRVKWRTQGDANDAADAEWVLQEQVRGRLWYSVPYLGRAATLVSNQGRSALIGLVAAGLAGYALLQLGGAWRERRRRPSGGAHAAS